MRSLDPRSWKGMSFFYFAYFCPKLIMKRIHALSYKIDRPRKAGNPGSSQRIRNRLSKSGQPIWTGSSLWGVWQVLTSNPSLILIEFEIRFRRKLVARLAQSAPYPRFYLFLEKITFALLHWISFKSRMVPLGMSRESSREFHSIRWMKWIWLERFLLSFKSDKPSRARAQSSQSVPHYIVDIHELS